MICHLRQEDEYEVEAIDDVEEEDWELPEEVD